MSMSCKTLPFKFYACRNLVFCFSISIFQYRKTSIEHVVIHSSHSGVCIELHHNRKHMLHLLHLTPQHQWQEDNYRVIKTFSRDTECNDWCHKKRKSVVVYVWISWHTQHTCTHTIVLARNTTFQRTYTVCSRPLGCCCTEITSHTDTTLQLPLHTQLCLSVYTTALYGR